jgi:hypothetical protein
MHMPRADKSSSRRDAQGRVVWWSSVVGCGDERVGHGPHRTTGLERAFSNGGRFHARLLQTAPGVSKEPPSPTLHKVCDWAGLSRGALSALKRRRPQDSRKLLGLGLVLCTDGLGDEWDARFLEARVSVSLGRWWEPVASSASCPRLSASTVANQVKRPGSESECGPGWLFLLLLPSPQLHLQ